MDNRAKYEPVARAAALRHGFDPDIFARQIDAESGQSWARVLAAVGALTVTPTPQPFASLVVPPPSIRQVTGTAATTAVTVLHVVARVLQAVLMPLWAMCLSRVAVAGCGRRRGARGVDARRHRLQMVGIHTMADAAQVVDVIPDRDRPYQLLIDEPMRQVQSPSLAETSVPCARLRLCPEPTVSHWANCDTLSEEPVEVIHMAIIPGVNYA
jgi:hypothetical protein